MLRNLNLALRRNHYLNLNCVVMLVSYKSWVFPLLLRQSSVFYVCCLIFFDEK